ncbi:hypothetical protein L1987_09254 [Smallanthus sonchifolius]|uniref:Uncharacterized protein n=1 Tax=Smallanthus sonchifolius TaxID=185202 RepID=A0ACB9JMY4_9ASTR|nr:hypothetical protein L1987_09254 [Smallanthus sonchifolius]
MKNVRLSVNLAKFDREGNTNKGEERRYQESRFRRQQCNQHENGGGGSMEDNGNKPYLNALLRNHGTQHQIREVAIPDDVDHDVVQWYDRSVLGKAKDLLELPGLQKTLTNEGLTDLELKYLRALQNYSSGGGGGNTRAGGGSRPADGTMVPETTAPTPIPVFPMHGDVQPNCMGIEEKSLNDMADGSIKSKTFRFESAQRIILPVGPKSRKRPRVEKADSDPFMLDDIIRGNKIGDNGTGKHNTKNSIPDLNSSMGPTMADPMGNQVKNDNNKQWEGHEGKTDLEKEIKATIEIGQAMGVDLRNREEMVRAAIQGEESQIGYP